MPAKRASQVARLLVVDDHEVVVEGLQRLLAREREFEVVGVARSGRDAVLRAGRLRPDIVLLDLRLPDMSGEDVCRAILADLPGSAVVVLATDPGEEAIRACLEAGAHAYVAKGDGLNALRQTLEQVTAARSNLALGQRQIAESLRKAMAAGSQRTGARVTPQQRRVLVLIAEGLTNKEVAARLYISESTVRFHTQNVKAALGARTRAELVMNAIGVGALAPARGGTPSQNGQR